MVNQRARLLHGSGSPVFTQNRYEGLGKCSFGKQPPEKIGEPKCNEERVGIKTCAKQSGDYGVTYKSQDSRNQRHAADGRQGFEQIHEG